jgi:hypothetical protein
MLKDVIQVSLLQKEQTDGINNIVSIFYGIQCSPPSKSTGNTPGAA